MVPGSRARRRENWILLHILIISCLLVIGFWIIFGVIPLPGFLTRSHWQRAYWTATDDDGRFEALDHLRDQRDAETERAFGDARERENARPYGEGGVYLR